MQRYVSTLSVPKMDCPSEERLIRLALDAKPNAESLAFDLSKRELRVVHTEEATVLFGLLEPLGLGARIKESVPVTARTAGSALKSVFSVPKMDCPSEERLIKMALGDQEDVRSLVFDLPQRELTVIHKDAVEGILSRLHPLGLGAVLKASSAVAYEHSYAAVGDHDDASEAKTLRLLLAINAVMFLFELTLGLWAQSTGLLADSLDMFADAAVIDNSCSMKSRKDCHAFLF